MQHMNVPLISLPAPAQCKFSWSVVDQYECAYMCTKPLIDEMLLC